MGRRAAILRSKNLTRRHPRLHRSPLVGSGNRRNRRRGSPRRLKRDAIRLQRTCRESRSWSCFRPQNCDAVFRCPVPPDRMLTPTMTNSPGIVRAISAASASMRSDLRCREENAHPAQGYLTRSDDVVRPIFRRFAVTIEVICIGLRHIGRFPALRARRSSVGCGLGSGRATPS